MDVKIEKKKGIRGIKPRQWAYIAAGACAVALVTWLATSDMASTYKVDRAGLNIAEATDGQFDDFVRVDGCVLPISTVQVSPEEGGIVREKVVEEGAKVRKGDVIIRLSNSNLDLQILNAEAEAEAIRRVADAVSATHTDPATYILAMKYIDTLREMTSGQDNKTVYIPYEASSVLSSIGSIKGLFKE